jgi:hypothetical protein
MEATMLIKVQHAGIVGIVVVLAIGLLWSIAVMSNWVPVARCAMADREAKRSR